MPAGKHEWPIERIEKLIAMCALNPRPSTREMAKECGVTRYAIHNKMVRLGLTNPANIPHQLQPSVEKAYRPPVYGRSQTLPTLESLKDL